MCSGVRWHVAMETVDKDYEQGCRLVIGIVVCVCVCVCVCVFVCVWVCVSVRPSMNLNEYRLQTQ